METPYLCGYLLSCEVVRYCSDYAFPRYLIDDLYNLYVP